MMGKQKDQRLKAFVMIWRWFSLQTFLVWKIAMTEYVCKCQQLRLKAFVIFTGKLIILTRRWLKISTTTIWLHFYKVSQMNSLLVQLCGRNLGFPRLEGCRQHCHYDEKIFSPSSISGNILFHVRGDTSLLSLFIEGLSKFGKNRVHPSKRASIFNVWKSKEG